MSFNSRKWMYVFIIVSVVYSGANIITTAQTITKNMEKNHIVAVLETDRVYKECSELLSISMKNDVELIVILNHWYYDVYDYACPACLDSFPNTLRPFYERRTWRLIEDENIIYSNILIIDLERRFDKEYDFITKMDDKRDIYLIRNNTLSTLLLLESLDIKIRKYK